MSTLTRYRQEKLKPLWDDLSAHKYDGWLLAAIVVAGAALRLYHLDTFAIWRDEAQTIFLARHSFPLGILHSLLSADVSPPLYYFILHFWEMAFQGDWGLRFLSVLLGVVSIPLIYWVGRRLFDADVALLAALTAALSPHHIVVSRTVRMYTLLPLASLLALYCTYRFVTVSSCSEPARSQRRIWLALVLSYAFVLYTHNVGVFLILSLNLFFFWEMLLRPAQGIRGRLGSWMAAQVIVVLLFVPWVPALLQQLRSQGAVMGPWLARQSRLGNTLRLLNELTGLAWPNGAPWLWMIVCALGALTVRFRRTLVAVYLRFSPELDLALASFFGPIVLAALLTPRTIGTIPSYVTLVALPGMCYVVARGVRSVRPRWVSLALLLLLVVVWVRTVSVTYVRRTSNLREVAAYVAAHAGERDVIVIAPDYLASTFNYYFRGSQRQAAFPSTLGRVEDITWVGWAEHWMNAGQAIGPTLEFVKQELPQGAQLWLVTPLNGYPNDPYFSQIRVLKSQLDEAYGPPQVVDSFPAAVEYAEVYVYE